MNVTCLLFTGSLALASTPLILRKKKWFLEIKTIKLKTKRLLLVFNKIIYFSKEKIKTEAVTETGHTFLSFT